MSNSECQPSFFFCFLAVDDRPEERVASIEMTGIQEGGGRELIGSHGEIAMSAVESSVVFFPRFSTLAGATSFATLPLDVSRFGGVQLQVWRGELEFGGMEPDLKVHLEESLDGVLWPAESSKAFSLNSTQPNSTRFFSVGFRLRWFRVRFELIDSELVTLYAEGILRAGGSGARAWPTAAPPPQPAFTTNVGEPQPPGRQANIPGDLFERLNPDNNPFANITQIR